jgi:nucleotide-binding universal stress UspA family protein
MTEQGKRRPVIVVGVDGSKQSTEAVQWASSYAEMVGGDLRAVIAWQQDVGFGYYPEGPRGLDHEATRTLDHVLVAALGDEKARSVERVIRRGNATSTLVEESANAALLVVGDRGYGGFAGLLLGSVGENCVRHGRCSVVVVRHEH